MVIFTFGCYFITNTKSSRNNATHSESFLLKAILHSKSGFVIFLIFITVLIVWGFSLRIAERPFMFYTNLNWDYVWNGFWSVIILISTGLNYQKIIK